MLDVAALQQENAALRAQLAQVLASNAELTVSIAKLNERVSELLAVAQRKQRKPTVPKPPEPPPVLEGDAKLAFESRPQPPELPPKTKPKKDRPYAPPPATPCGVDRLRDVLSNSVEGVEAPPLHLGRQHLDDNSGQRVGNRLAADRCRGC